MNHVKRHIHLLSLIAASLLLAACNCGHADDTFQQQRHAIEDSIAAGNGDYAMKAIARKMAEADDSTTYYLWLSTLNKAYYTDMKIDSMTATLDRIGAYLDRHADHHDQATDQLRAEWYLGKGVYNSVILGRPDSAQVYNGHAITLLRQTAKEREQILTALTNQADYYRQMGKLDLSADSYLQALALADSMQTNPNARIVVMLGISTAYTFMADYTNSDLWWKRTARLLPHMQQGDRFIYYNNRGNDYYLQDNYRRALPYFLKAAQLVKDDPKREWDYYTVQANLGETYACLGKAAPAKTAIHQADSFFRKVGFDIGLYYTHTSQMNIAMLEGRHAVALGIARESDTPQYMIPAAMVQRLKAKENVFRQMGRYDEAYTAHRQMHTINDSLQTANIQMRMNTNMLRYRHDKQIAEQQHIIDHQRYLGALAWGLFLFAVVVILAMCFAIVLLRRRRQMREMKARQEMLKLRMKNTRNRISPHFIYNALNHEMLAQMNGHEVNLNTLTQLLRRGVERADALMSTLNEEMEFVGYYVNIEAQQMGDNFSYTTHVAPDVDADRVRLPAMVIQIFAENAIKHGLRPLKADSPRLLDISVTREQTMTRIEVKDNGVGLTAGSVGEHTGMKVVRQTIQILNDHNREKITFGVTNYKDDNGMSGCRSWIMVPDEYNYNL